MKNYFGLEKFGPAQALEDEDVRRLALDMFGFVSEIAGGDTRAASQLIYDLADCDPPIDQEEAVAKLARQATGGQAGWADLGGWRAADILAAFNNVLPPDLWPLQGPLLDLGCGTGDVSRALVGTQDVALADVVDYRTEASSALEFDLLSEGQPLPYLDDTFGAVILNAVLHHCSDPTFVLREAKRVSRDLLYIRESVVGLRPREQSYPATRALEHGDAIWARLADFQSRFEKLPTESQLRHASLQDWIYNHLVQGDVPVPLNFATDAQWRSVFRREGLRLLFDYRMGFDERVSPEFHWLYVCRVA